MTPKAPRQWYVHVWVAGYYSGSYEHGSRELAEADMKERRKLFTRLHCHYELSASPKEPR